MSTRFGIAMVPHALLATGKTNKITNKNIKFARITKIKFISGTQICVSALLDTQIYQLG